MKRVCIHQEGNIKLTGSMIMSYLKKCLIVFALFFAISDILSEAQVKITSGAVLTMDANSLLELESTNKGLLIPRMAVNSLTLPAPLTAPVPAGMQVYSIGGSIPDGFYFWNGTRWIGFNATEVPVIKSASATLLLSETFVLASGDITLTLPVVTVAENGLSVTVKNNGTYLNLITIIGNSGATIDGAPNQTLTRWRSHTLVAWGGNWVSKSRDIRFDNLLDVSPHESFATIAEVVGFLNAHMSGPTIVRLDAGTFHIAATQTINLPYPVTFLGGSFGETTIIADAGVSGSPLFTCTTESYFKMLIFNGFSTGSGNDAIRFTGSGVYYETKDCYFFGFNRGIATTSNTDLWIFESDFENCTGAGIEIAAGAASGGSVKISECDFTRCGKGISLLSAVSETVSLMNSTFYNTLSGSDIGILYTPGTFTTFSSMFITGNAWNNQGTFISGFDFTRSDGRDANVFLMNNAGEEDANPHCKVNVVNNGSTTNCTLANTWYKAIWTNTSSYTTNFLIGNNKLTYQSMYKRDVYIIVSGNVLVDKTNRNITIGILKNGVTTTRYGETTLRITVANQPFQFATVIYLSDIANNDFMELFCSTIDAGDHLIFQDINIFVNSQ
jgi:hypothetical protein